MNTPIATIVDSVRNAQRDSQPGNAQGSDIGKWIIIAASVFGALMLMRGARRFTKLLGVIFWLWFWTHGAKYIL
jgi:hypothetical protein